MHLFKSHVRRGHWDFQFYSFGYFLDRFFDFCARRLWFFSFGIHCSLWIFLFFSIWFSVFIQNTSGFSVLVSDVVFVFVSYFVLFGFQFLFDLSSNLSRVAAKSQSY